MKPSLVILLGVFSVLLYDCVGSLLSRSLGFEYSWLAVGSILLYGWVGFAASRDSLIVGVLAAIVVGIVDATLGWYISWVIGPGRISEELSSLTVLSVICFVAALSGISGFIGALAARGLKPS